MGALLAGFPTLPSRAHGTALRLVCEAVIGSRAIEAGDIDIVLAGGVESISRAPYVVEKSPRPWPSVGNQSMSKTSMGGA